MGHISTPEFDDLLSRYPGYGRRVYIETGLLAGDQLMMAAPLFEKVYGIELDPYWLAKCRERTKAFPHITLYEGESQALLPEVLATYPDTSCCIYLDAHYCKTDPPLKKSVFPLWSELETIKRRNPPDIVIVDDVHTFGTVRDDVRFRAGDKEWESVTVRSILEFFSDRVAYSSVVADSFVVWTSERASP